MFALSECVTYGYELLNTTVRGISNDIRASKMKYEQTSSQSEKKAFMQI